MSRKVKLTDFQPDEKRVIPIDKLCGRYIVDINGNVFSTVGRYIRKVKQYLSPNGYVKVNLTVNRKNINLLVHRLVAISFLDNVGNKETVNHKDGNKQNNNVNNLEWATASENAKHAFAIGLNRSPIFTPGANEKRTKTLRDRIMKGEILPSNTKQVICEKSGVVFSSLRDAAKYLRCNYSHLSEQLRGRVTNTTTLNYYEPKN